MDLCYFLYVKTLICDCIHTLQLRTDIKKIIQSIIYYKAAYLQFANSL